MLLLSPGRWWVLAVQGLLDVVFGFFVLFYAQMSSASLVWAFAILAASNGVIGVLVALRERHFLEHWWVSGLIAVLNLGLGFFIVCFNEFRAPVSENFLTVFMGIQALVQGSMGFGVSFEMNRVFKVRGAFLFYGILSMAGGILVLAAPYASMLDFFTLIASYAILAGLGLGLDSLRLKRMAPRGGLQ